MHSTANGAGWIKLHRAVKHSRVYRDSERLHLWIHLMLSANHEPATVKLDDGREIELAAGQLIVSRSSLARATGICESKIERTINRFKTEQMIEQITFSKFRIISICNWHEYQSSEQITEQKPNQKPNTVKKIRIKEENTLSNLPGLFEEIWRRYPVKDGKWAALKSFLATVKDERGYQRVSAALDNYTRHLEKETWKKAKNGSTWFNNWHDWIEETAGGPVSTWQDEQQRSAVDDILNDD